jgi:hypothetical protein
MENIETDSPYWYLLILIIPVFLLVVCLYVKLFGNKINDNEKERLKKFNLSERQKFINKKGYVPATEFTSEYIMKPEKCQCDFCRWDRAD